MWCIIKSNVLMYLFSYTLIIYGDSQYIQVCLVVKHLYMTQEQCFRLLEALLLCYGCTVIERQEPCNRFAIAWQ